jgi:FixJ family two-component response regulator
MMFRPNVTAQSESGVALRLQASCSRSRTGVLTIIPVISIIDDDASIRAGLNNLVRSLGYVVSAFASAEAFLQSAQLHNTWCVIADVRMPGTSGVQLQSDLRRQGYRVPFIFITAVPDECIRRQALNDGAICFLTKPFNEDILIDCLNSAVERYGDGASR